MEVLPCSAKFDISNPLYETTVFQKLQKNATFPSLPSPSKSRHWNKNWAFLCWNDIIENLC